ncbi:MAG: RnfABCDGE type electron transport complex subunit G [Candidatus Omnitrophica bacterium]|jgi:electron transport complex protein RnfG|nr:RnfABCDGE type electron transport complex subunit G [Candidatus Omnitrophota bacterium]
MKEMLKYSLILCFICIAAAGLLSGVYSITNPRIEAQAQAEIKTSLKQVLPQAATFEPIVENKEILYYKARNAKKEIIGVVFTAIAKGYSSAIETMAAMTPNGEIIAIKVIAQNETPGLGTRITEKEFTSRFAKKSIDELSKVSTISGATISSSSVITSIKQKGEEIRKYLK